ncbi:DUF262 domain-containing protein [Mesorhizobium sp. LNJC384A00]|uniref:GmrSD restriction endonuclease domain-containing protein n=1 Tax=Mesorhizobium sp. LNJC384A00 TaxID=1287268 RepID=UPI0003FD2280|nr:DUF262 domain-containing protein [Mesorhizobium sp. LNJC384A00]
MANPELENEVSVTGIEEADDEPTPRVNSKISPDEFFAKHAFRIVYQTNNFLLPQLRELVSRGDILNIRPEYQRRLRWITAQKSRLIESLLLNIPVPPIFLYETDQARYEVMDGQQRLNAIREFFDGDFALSGLQVLSPLNGLRYSKAPPRIKRALDRSSLSAIVLLLESDSERDPDNKFSITDVRRFIFDRLNTGGTKLNAQELRNAINPGFFTKATVDLARHPLFTEIFGIPPYVEANPSDYYQNPARQKNNLYATMGDCQLVVRYFALRDAGNIRGSMKSMLDRAMESRTQLSETEVDVLKKEYIDRLTTANIIFGPKPFLLPPDEKDRIRISAALYDATLVALHRLWGQREKFVADAPAIRERLQNEFKHEANGPIITGQANTAQAVRDRIGIAQRVLTGVAG